MNSNTQQQVPSRRLAWAATMGVLLVTVASVSGLTTPIHKRSAPSRRSMTMKLAHPTSKTKARPELSSRGASGIPAGSALSMICEDQQQEFDMNVGHAMDVLRTDYPEILTCQPGKKRIKRYACRQLCRCIMYCIQKSNLSLHLIYFRLLHLRQRFRGHWSFRREIAWSFQLQKFLSFVTRCC